MIQKIDPELALKIVRYNRDPIAYDTETTGLTVHDKVCGYVITNRDYSIYVPVRHEAGGNIPNVEEFESELAQAFRYRESSGFRTVGHNLGFDLRISHRHNVILGSPLEDTMINEAIILPTRRVPRYTRN
jgi:DNA polymerase I-like protein with 3'-5' exonuclease and polymerase domains